MIKTDIIFRYISFGFFLILFTFISFFVGCIHGEESIKKMQYDIARKEIRELRKDVDVLRTQVNQLAPLLKN